MAYNKISNFLQKNYSVSAELPKEEKEIIASLKKDTSSLNGKIQNLENSEALFPVRENENTKNIRILFELLNEISGTVDNIITTSDFHVYAHGTLGSDSNDGLTEEFPKATIQAAFNLIPKICAHNVTVHLSGTFTNNSAAVSGRLIGADDNLSERLILVDGGDHCTTIAGDFTADISETSNIGTTTNTWTPNQYGGYWVEIIDGAAAGELRTIFSNTATTITPMKDFSTDPGAATYRIVRPTTELKNTASSLLYSMKNIGTVSVQRLYLSGSVVLAGNDTEYTSFAGLVYENTLDSVVLSAANCTNGIMCKGTIYNPSTYATLSDDDVYTGVSIRGDGDILARSSGVGNSFFGVYTEGSLEVYGGNLVVSYGTKLKKVILHDISRDNSSQAVFDQSPAWSYPPLTVSGSGGVGIELNHCAFSTRTGVTIEGCTSHGIEAKDSFIEIDRVLSGSGNGGAGLYIHTASRCVLRGSGHPTLSGAFGEVSLNGTSEESTWSTIADGAAINGATVNNNEFVIVKKKDLGAKKINVQQIRKLPSF